MRKYSVPHILYAAHALAMQRSCGRRYWDGFNRLLNLSSQFLAGRTSMPSLYPPIFIIGAPRSGSTLLYQLLIEAFGFGYFSNVHCALWGAPDLASSFLNLQQVPHRPDYVSRFGMTHGWDGPSECGEFWYRFFPRRPHFAPTGTLNDRQLLRLRTAVTRLIEGATGPFLFKNLYCSLRLAPLREALPEALFIVVRRRLADNAKSILAVRREMYGDYRRWWSMEPELIGRLRWMEPHEQVVEQIVGVNQAIADERTCSGGDRFFDVAYEDVCANPMTVVRNIEMFLRRCSYDCVAKEVIAAVGLSGRRLAWELPEELAIAVERYAKDRYGNPT